MVLESACGRWASAPPPDTRETRAAAMHLLSKHMRTSSVSPERREHLNSLGVREKVRPLRGRKDREHHIGERRTPAGSLLARENRADRALQRAGRRTRG